MISIVVPALDEAAGIAAALDSARDPAVGEILLVDGGSQDGTPEIARRLGASVLTAARGRALQMNAGAAAARGAILLFLHADTRLPAGFGRAVEEAIASGAVGGRFDAVLSGEHPFLPVIAGLMNARSRWSGIATGDQAIFVTRGAFEAAGRFPEIPLMEDVAFSARLRRLGRIAPLRLRVATSARRWEQDGVARTILLMWSLRLAFALGAKPERLARFYRAAR
jgi:rSAM/selenodomain-associated transferase 2